MHTPRVLTRHTPPAAKLSQIQLRKIEGLNRGLKDCQADATAFNCLVSVFSKTTIYSKMQELRETHYVTNSQGEVVQRATLDDGQAASMFLQPARVRATNTTHSPVGHVPSGSVTTARHRRHAAATTTATTAVTTTTTAVTTTTTAPPP